MITSVVSCASVLRNPAQDTCDYKIVRFKATQENCIHWNILSKEQDLICFSSLWVRKCVCGDSAITTSDFFLFGCSNCILNVCGLLCEQLTFPNWPACAVEQWRMVAAGKEWRMSSTHAHCLSHCGAFMFDTFDMNEHMMCALAHKRRQYYTLVLFATPAFLRTSYRICIPVFILKQYMVV